MKNLFLKCSSIGMWSLGVLPVVSLMSVVLLGCTSGHKINLPNRIESLSGACEDDMKMIIKDFIIPIEVQRSKLK